MLLECASAHPRPHWASSALPRPRKGEGSRNAVLTTPNSLHRRKEYLPRKALRSPRIPSPACPGLDPGSGVDDRGVRPVSRSLRRAAQFGGALGLGGFGLHRVDLADLDARGFDAGDGLATRCVSRTLGWMQRFRRMRRARTRHHPRHQHLAALMAEVAIGEAHAGHRAAKTALVVLVDVEAGVERKPLDRGADRLS